MVAFPAGGLADVMARSVQPQLGEALGQPLVIENRGGTGGNVAGTEVARNGGDGLTFLITTSTTESVNPSIFARMPFDPQKDLQPVALLANSQLFLITRATLAANSRTSSPTLRPARTR
jgi:tripartite-type tricarboxylate transporter receptor subunit TctC